MRKGFTLVEILIVVALSALLSTFALIYTSESRNQVALSVETAKIAEIILQAKELAIATYNDTPQTCGYGAVFNIANDTYSIFAYTPQNHAPEHVVAPPCPDDTLANTSPIYGDEIQQFSQSTWNTHVAAGVKMVDGGNGDTLAVVLFYPPAPTTWISRDGTNFLDPDTNPNVVSKIYLVTTDGSASSTISVNGAGQVSF